MARGRRWRVLAAAVCTAAALGAPAGAADETPRVQRDGRWLVDQHNRVVLVHGVNAVWKRAPFYPPATAEGFVVADAACAVAVVRPLDGRDALPLPPAPRIRTDRDLHQPAALPAGL